MPLYLDIHSLPDDATPERVQEAHAADVSIQDEYGVCYQGYFYNHSGRTVACIVHGPSMEACIEVHRRAHGLEPEKMIEVSQDLVHGFLGGGSIAATGDQRLPDGSLDPGVRVLVVTELDNLASVGARKGDQAALRLVEQHDRIIRGLVSKHGGREVRHTGDGMMLSFPLASSAVACALAIQGEAGSDADEMAAIRIGIAAGEPVSQYETLFGTAVEQARVICRAAYPGEVLVSSAVRDLCAGKGLAFSSAPAVHAPGMRQPIELATAVGTASASTTGSHARPAHDRLRRANSVLANRYALESDIDRGGMATVYTARDLRHDRRVAVKVLRPELATSIGSDRFLEEIRVVSRLTHPNIVSLYDSGEADGALYYVMPFLEGDTLRQIITRERRVPVERAIEIARGVAAALDHAHRNGVIHRDIKPENIIMLEGVPMVLDFGIALAVTQAGGDRLTQPGISIGTPAYMSPEQASGDAAIDVRTDVYALGCVTFEMITGEPPFSATTVQSLMAKIITDPPPRLSDFRENIPEQLDRALQRALSKNPSERYPSVREFSAALATPS